MINASKAAFDPISITLDGSKRLIFNKHVIQVAAFSAAFDSLILWIIKHPNVAI